MTLPSFLRPRLLARVILNGVLLLVVSAVGFIFIASVLLGDDARRAERAMAKWYASEACEAYARAGAEGGIAKFPIVFGLYTKDGEELATSTSQPLVQPSISELRTARQSGPTPIESSKQIVVACPDDSQRYAIVGGPRHPPPILRLAIAVMAVVLLVAVASIPLARSLVKPLRELVGTATRFGEGDLAARASVRRSDEIGDLATAFNLMAAKLEERLLAEKEMLANVSHELRTPLARARVVLETAKEDPARSASLLREISHDLSDLERLTDDVLATIRLDFEGAASRGLRLRPEDVDLPDVVRHSIARIVEAHPDRDVELDAPEAVPSLRGDPALLLRLFDNLLDNARKYSSGTVSVHVREERRELVVEIRDRGIGIEQSDLERIFEPFFRTDRSRQRATGGTGLGLALCRRIVDVHRGTIAASSSGGEGTTVIVRLPLA
ncbi:periplasmic sensor signal transduction histidine kinase [Labilithrix luteola]|uniref:histidine kinase n=1 Tax=Labilithrix luteola TaxID=1391654 RepID=A0A0K1PST1_9BACT|nr:HAMP domain-containing sensor histidine kinase [Labilithrix luteola]AKU96600.1 periplasmic sensor signal transduction histidine kinase [Labilithrix luteola]